jgi:hypothetical protein
MASGAIGAYGVVAVAGGAAGGAQLTHLFLGRGIFTAGA